MLSFLQEGEVSTLQGRRGRAEGHLPRAVAVSGSQQSGLLLEQSFTVHSGAKSASPPQLRVSVPAGVVGKREGKEKGLKRKVNEFLQMKKI